MATTGKTRKRKAGRSRRAALLQAAAAPSPRAVATARHKLQRRVKADRRQRYQDYTRWLGEQSRLKAAVAVGAEPPRILAEGDSWFDYPVPGGGGGVITQLESLLKIQILNMAHAGDEVRQMLALAQREEIEARLSDPSLKFDALLFSGGGNDLVGDQFCLWLRDAQPGIPPQDLLDRDRLKAILGVVQAGYCDLIAIRDRLSPNTKIFLHGYDFPRVTGRGVCGFGPWLKPSLEFRGVHDPNDQASIVRALLEQFATMLRSLAEPAHGIFFVPTQGTLDPDQDWANEIHPTRKGFKKIAGVFRDALQTHLPSLAAW